MVFRADTTWVQPPYWSVITRIWCPVMKSKSACIYPNYGGPHGWKASDWSNQSLPAHSSCITTRFWGTGKRYKKLPTIGKFRTDLQCASPMFCYYPLKYCKPSYWYRKDHRRSTFYTPGHLVVTLESTHDCNWSSTSFRMIRIIWNGESNLKRTMHTLVFRITTMGCTSPVGSVIERVIAPLWDRVKLN